MNNSQVSEVRELGVPLIIRTDSLATEHLDFMCLGVAVARRGWCQAADILNTRPVYEYLSFLRGKA